MILPSSASSQGTLSRRRALIGGLAAMMVPSFPMAGLAGAVPGDRETRFVAYRNGSRFGTHLLRFTPDGEDLRVHVEIDFSVGIGPIKLFRYTHRNDEVWRGGRLLSLASTTDDDGDEYWVKARADGDVLRVEGSSGRLELPGDTLSTSYWHERTVRRGQWLDTQKGRLMRSSVTEKGPEEVNADGGVVEAVRYGLDGDITCDLWYRDQQWVKLLFTVKDSEIEYKLGPSAKSAT